jgi:hypothetical protein
MLYLRKAFHPVQLPRKGKTHPYTRCTPEVASKSVFFAAAGQQLQTAVRSGNAHNSGDSLAVRVSLSDISKLPSLQLSSWNPADSTVAFGDYPGYSCIAVDITNLSEGRVGKSCLDIYLHATAGRRVGFCPHVPIKNITTCIDYNFKRNTLVPIQLWYGMPSGEHHGTLNDAVLHLGLQALGKPRKISTKQMTFT